MLQRWTDHNGEEHRVLEDYERNRRLIDLSHQPEDIKEIITNTISTATLSNKDGGQVGIRLMKFGNLYDLKKIADQAQAYAEPLNARYSNEIKTLSV
jgi:polyphosphate kinase